MSGATLSAAAAAILAGGALGVGATLILWAVAPRWRAASLERRIAPYLRDVADPRGLTPLSAAPFRERWHTAVLRLGALAGGSHAVGRRLAQAGWSMDAAAFRARQVVWATTGLVIGGALALALAVGGVMAAALLVLPVIGAVAGAMWLDVRLTGAGRRRSARMAQELPTVLEFLALCLTAGEGVLDALRRVTTVGTGEVVDALRRAVLEVGTGSTLSESLARMGRDAPLPALTRSIDHIVAALDRGAPLAQVLQAQASDAREAAQRTLIEQAGRREILMLLPLVFLILPLSVLFAVFPGVVMLQTGI